MNTWILCPNLWGARLFYYGDTDPELRKLQFVREYPRPTLKTKIEDFPDDDDLADLTPPVEDPELTKRVAHKYMHFLGKELEHSCVDEKYQSLIVCAEPHLLSILLDEMGPCSRAKLIGTIDLDLYESNESDLIQYVEDLLKKQSRRVQYLKTRKSA